MFAGGGVAALLGSAWSRLQEAAVEARPVVDDILERVTRGAGHGQ